MNSLLSQNRRSSSNSSSKVSDIKEERVNVSDSEDNSPPTQSNDKKRIGYQNHESSSKGKRFPEHEPSFKKYVNSNELIDEEGNRIFLVEFILDEKKMRGAIYFKVRWQGYSSEHDSWEPSSNLQNSGVLEMIRSFRRARISQKKKLVKATITSPSSFSTIDVVSESVAAGEGFYERKSTSHLLHISSDLYSNVKTRRSITNNFSTKGDIMNSTLIIPENSSTSGKSLRRKSFDNIDADEDATPTKKILSSPPSNKDLSQLVPLSNVQVNLEYSTTCPPSSIMTNSFITNISRHSSSHSSVKTTVSGCSSIVKDRKVSCAYEAGTPFSMSRINETEMPFCERNNTAESDRTTPCGYVEQEPSINDNKATDEDKRIWASLPRGNITTSEFYSICEQLKNESDEVQWDKMQQLVDTGILRKYGLDRSGIIPLIYVAVELNIYSIVNFFFTRLNTPANLIAFSQSYQLFLYALKKCTFRMIKLFLEHGVNVNCRNESDGFNAYAYALEKADTEVMNILLTYGVDFKWPHRDEPLASMMQRELRRMLQDNSVMYRKLSDCKKLVDVHLDNLDSKATTTYYRMRTMFAIEQKTMKYSPFKFVDLFREPCHWTFNAYRPGGYIIICYFKFVPGELSPAFYKSYKDDFSKTTAFDVDEDYSFTLNVSYDGIRVPSLSSIKENVDEDKSNKDNSEIACYHIDLPLNRNNVECNFIFTLDPCRRDGKPVPDDFDLSRYYFKSDRKVQYRFCISYYTNPGLKA